MSKQQAIDIDAMVSRFLCWRLPKDFAPDGRVKFDRVFLVFDGFDGAQPIDISDAPDHYWPTGTNLFTAEQAKAMIEHMLGIGPTKDRHKLPPSEQECEHRKLSYCHGSSLWVCAECDEGLTVDEFRRQFMEPPEEDMTIAGDGASELGKLMREQRKGGPVPDHI